MHCQFDRKPNQISLSGLTAIEHSAKRASLVLTSWLISFAVLANYGIAQQIELSQTREPNSHWQVGDGESSSLLILPRSKIKQKSSFGSNPSLFVEGHRGGGGTNSAPGRLASQPIRVSSSFDANKPASSVQQPSLPGDPFASGGLESIGPATKAPHTKDDAPKPAIGADGQTVDPHAEVFAHDLYPSAAKCAQCHKKIYDEWRVSGHAYAAVSPMFQKFEQAVSEVTQGTIGYFCMRCHAPVATQMNYPRDMSIVDGPAVFREGITCVACHRVKYPFDRVNGERRIEPGDIFAPVYGGGTGEGVEQVKAKPDHYKVKLNRNDKLPGQELHNQAIQFEQISYSEFCVSCHQVVVHPGIALEVVWAQYRSAPAFKKGVTCQDCHMGLVPGKDSGYATAPCAEMSGKVVDPNRKHSNHMFYGPGYSIAHPGVFPHHEKSLRWNVQQWLEFDWRGGWGTPEFEKKIAGTDFEKTLPTHWQSSDERRDARKIVDENLELIQVKRNKSIEVMANGFKVDGPFFKSARNAFRDIEFKYSVTNISEGHNAPSGSLGAQPQLWLHVVLVAPDGKTVWESGYTDGNGDLADLHSLQVNKGLCPPDYQLFNLQTKFLTTGVKGPDREVYIPVPVDLDQLIFFRPGALPITVLNHPPLIRMEAHSLPPLGTKVAN
ncbi:MAG: hypothetical protein RLY14_2225, partial [Planctomycetota bacterium]